MNKFLTASLALASLILVVGCSQQDPADHEQMKNAATPEAALPAADSTAAKGVATIYTCPMHPEVVSSQPGQCPKCGMDLVVKK